MKCSHCGEHHTSSKCPALSEALKDGFYSGGGGGGGHSHDEEDVVKNGFMWATFGVKHSLKQQQTTKCLIPTITT